MGEKTLRTPVLVVARGLWPFAAMGSFHLQEATIADIHRAILAKELTATELVGLYLKRIEAYNGQCIKATSMPAALCLATSSRLNTPARSAP